MDPNLSVTIQDGSVSSEECGYFCYRPRLLQNFATAKSAVFFLSILSCLMSVANNALPGVVLQTLETRYGLSSFQTGLIVSGAEISGTLGILFIISLIKRFDPMPCISVGGLLAGIGCLCFAFPQSLRSENYDPNSVRDEDFGKLWWIFLFAMMIIGIGNIPPSVLSYTYFDENVIRSKAPIYHSLYGLGSFLGALLGFVIGGAMLSFPVDYLRDHPSVENMNQNHPNYVGAWWLPWMINGILLVFISVLIWPFPNELKDKRLKLQTETHEEVNEAYNNPEANRPPSPTKNQTTATGTHASSSIFITPSQVKNYLNLTKNPTFILTNLGLVADAFVVQMIIAFSVKLCEQNFNIPANQASNGLAVICIVGMIGQVMGAQILARYKFDIKTILRDSFKFRHIQYSFWSPILGSICALSYFIYCPTTKYASYHHLKHGPKIERYHAINTLDHLNWSNYACNATKSEHGPISCDNPNCSLDNFDPICDTYTGMQWFSSCFLNEQCLISDRDQFYTQQPENLFKHRLIEGACPNQISCPSHLKKFYIFIFLTSIMFFFKSLAITPLQNVIIRCVPFKDRTDALALTSFLARSLGSIPSPIIIGKLIDHTCILWSENNSCEKTNCVAYSHSSIAIILFWTTFIIKILGATSLFYASKYHISDFSKEEVLVENDQLENIDLEEFNYDENNLWTRNRML